MSASGNENLKFAKPKRIKNRSLLDSFHTQRCIACRRKGCDPAHIKTRKTGGDDTLDNVMALCRLHHREQSDKGWLHMSKKYFPVLLELGRKNWTLDRYGKLQRTETIS